MSWTTPDDNPAENVHSRGTPLPKKYLFLSGRDRSYTGLVRAHVLERHHRNKATVLSKGPDGENERSVVPSNKVLGPALSIRTDRARNRARMILSPGSGLIDPFVSFARQTSETEDFLADFCKMLRHRKVQVFDRSFRYWQFIGAIWP